MVFGAKLRVPSEESAMNTVGAVRRSVAVQSVRQCGDRVPKIGQYVRLKYHINSGNNFQYRIRILSGTHL